MYDLGQTLTLSKCWTATIAFCYQLIWIALFDKGLITFDSKGKMHVIEAGGCQAPAGIGSSHVAPFYPKGLVPYLNYHRSEVFQNSKSGLTQWRIIGNQLSV